MPRTAGASKGERHSFLGAEEGIPDPRGGSLHLYPHIHPHKPILSGFGWLRETMTLNRWQFKPS